MMYLTGIEFGPDYCVLVGTRHRRESAALTAIRVVAAAEWNVDHPARVELLRSLRSSLGLPRDCVVVHWDRGEAGDPDSPLRLFAEAGFRILTVSTPTEALAALASVTPRPHGALPTAWLALNTNGGAIVVVRESAVIYSRSFEWTISAPAERRQAHLLRRYLRVAQVVPELRRAIQTAHATDGVIVGTAITCGNLPDLRSLTMPLIEATDIEVETLDSTAGLEYRGPTTDLEEAAAVIRLAAAAAVMSPAAGRNTGGRKAAVAVVVTVLVAGAAWWAYSEWAASRREMRSAPMDARGAVVGMRPGQGEIPEVASSRGTAPVPAAAVEPRPEAESQPAPGEPATARARKPRRETTATSGSVTPRPGSEPGARRLPDSGRDATAAAEARLPSVDGIIISAQLRLAVIDGVVVGVGDSVGSRRVARIEQEAVVLQDASGREVRVPVRPREPG